MYHIRQHVQARFSRIMNRRITKLGMGTTPACQQLLDKMILVGVSRLEHQRALEKEEALVVCDENLLRLINQLQERAMFLGTFPLVDEKAFEQMQKRMSPTWPFC